MAVRVAAYSSGSAFSKRRPPDAKQELSEIKSEINELLSNKTIDRHEVLTDEEQILLLKKQMEYFN